LQVTSSTWSALGNTYVVIAPDPGRPLDPARVQALVGDTDGIVEVVSAGVGEMSVVIWNPDGSQAELSGNGTRIAAAWLAERTGARRMSVHVGTREVVTSVLESGEIEQDLGAVQVGPREVVAGTTIVPVLVGNPHAVVVGDPDEIQHVGPLLETHPRFPDRTNVQVVRVNGPGDVTARVWERGVGETPSSGTSAVAVAAATHDAGDVLVHFPGGDLRVRLESGRAHLTGPAVRVR
jgi:diaminopimelate epimerase